MISVFKSIMQFDSLKKKMNEVQNSSNDDISEEDLPKSGQKTQRVDINVLRSKLQESENKQFKKNLLILSTLLLTLGFLGIYLSF